MNLAVQSKISQINQENIVNSVLLTFLLLTLFDSIPLKCIN